MSGLESAAPLRVRAGGGHKPMGWTDVFRFGKYAGLTVEDVASFNPQYLAWAVNNLDGFDLAPEARKLGQKQLNLHRDQSFQRQNGWAYGFGRAVKSAAESWRSKMWKLEHDARERAKARRTTDGDTL